MPLGGVQGRQPAGGLPKDGGSINRTPEQPKKPQTTGLTLEAAGSAKADAAARSRVPVNMVGIPAKSPADGKPSVKVPDLVRQAFDNVAGNLSGTSTASPDSQISFLRKQIKSGDFTPEMAGELAKDVDDPQVLLELAGKLDRHPKQDKSATSAFNQSQTGDLGKVMDYVKRAESAEKKSGSGSLVKAEFMKKALGSPDLVQAGLNHVKEGKDSIEINAAYDKFFGDLLEATGEDPLDFGERMFLNDLPKEQAQGQAMFFRGNSSLSSKFFGSVLRENPIDVSGIQDNPFESAMTLLGSDAVKDSPAGKLMGRMMSVTRPSGTPPVGSPADVLVAVMVLKGLAPKLFNEGNKQTSKILQKTANKALNGTSDRKPLDEAVEKFVSGSNSGDMGLSSPLAASNSNDPGNWDSQVLNHPESGKPLNVEGLYASVSKRPANGDTQLDVPPVVNRGTKPAVDMTGWEAAKTLKDMQYVVRKSQTNPGTFSVSYHDGTGVKHKNYNSSDVQAIRAEYSDLGYSAY